MAGPGAVLLKLHGCAEIQSSLLVTSTEIVQPPWWASHQVGAAIERYPVVFLGVGSVASYIKQTVQLIIEMAGSLSSVWVVAPDLSEDWALGRVDVLWLENGSALVMWLERRPRTGEVLVRQVWPDGRMGGEALVTTTSAGRDSGFPRMIQDGMGRLVFAWTQTGSVRQVRVARTREAVR
ncbi:MAG: hypothetical protein IH921_02885 [Gemmatimonadetes bacterium]|nr:hypothetical protein [Gemmatimonadota bacterium]